MKQSMLRTLLLLAFSFLVPLVYAGPTLTDDFNDNSRDGSRWGADFNFEGTGGTFTETSGHLEFTLGSPEQVTKVRPWILQSPGYGQDWELIVSVTDTKTFPTSNEGISIGLAVQNSGNPAEALTAEIYSENFGTPTEGFFSAMINGPTELGFFETGDLNVSQGMLRIAFNSSTKVLRTYYRTSGSWIQMASYGVAGSGGATANANWGLNNASTFNLGIFAFTGGATVAAGLLTADNFQLTLNTQDSSVNTPPSFDTSPGTATAIGEPYLYQATASDAEMDSVTFSKFAGPAWLSVGTDGTVSGTPLEADTGSFSVVIRATDSGLTPASTDQSFTLNVRATFAGWQKLHFDLPSELADAAPDADPDLDGVPNLIEYALRTDPKMDIGNDPVMLSFDGNDLFQMTVEVRDDAPGLSAVAQIDPTILFVAYMELPGVQTDPTPGDGFATMTFTDITPRTFTAGRFARFLVTTTE